jgi:hypothetical protein
MFSDVKRMELRALPSLPFQWIAISMWWLGPYAHSVNGFFQNGKLSTYYMLICSTEGQTGGLQG